MSRPGMEAFSSVTVILFGRHWMVATPADHSSPVNTPIQTGAIFQNIGLLGEGGLTLAMRGLGHHDNHTPHFRLAGGEKSGFRGPAGAPGPSCAPSHLVLVSAVKHSGAERRASCCCGTQLRVT